MNCWNCGSSTLLWSDREGVYRCATCASPVTDGLGDKIASFTQRLGIPHCRGCDERRLSLNRRFPGRARRR